MNNQDENSYPLLLDVKAAAKKCNVGVTLFRELDADGSLPEASKLHSRKLWSARQLEIWSVMGCPPRNSDIWRRMLDCFKKEPEKYL